MCQRNAFANVTIFAGLFGSGKTNLAANAALAQKKQGHEVVLLDMDVVNPLFRLSELSDFLRQEGIALQTPGFAGTNVDIPALPGSMGSLLRGGGRRKIIIDLGGDDVGAAALGQFAPFLAETGYEMLFVYNAYRPFSHHAAEASQGLRAIENVARLAFTGIAANPNLGQETTAETIFSAKGATEALAKAVCLPVVFTAAAEGLPVSEETVGTKLFPIRILLDRAGAKHPAG